MVLFFNGYCMNSEDINICDVTYINGIVKDDEIDALFEKYGNEVTIIIGYSFGCYYASKFINKFSDISHIKTIAICGTPNIIDRKLGINPIIIKRMLSNMSCEVMEDFYEKIGFKKKYSLEQATEELDYIINNYQELENKFKVAILSRDDLIFPLKKLESQYDTKYIIDAKHYVFSSKEFHEKFYEVLENTI